MQQEFFWGEKTLNEKSELELEIRSSKTDPKLKKFSKASYESQLYIWLKLKQFFLKQQEKTFTAKEKPVDLFSHSQ